MENSIEFFLKHSPRVVLESSRLSDNNRDVYRLKDDSKT